MSIYYFPLENYTLKCRLYPTKSQAKRIDDLIHYLHVYHNNVIHDIRNGNHVKEYKNEKYGDQVVHYPDYKSMKEKEFLNYYRENDERIKQIPATALTGQSGIISDIMSAHKKTGNHPVEQWGEKYTDENGNEIEKGAKYYTKSNPRTSLPVVFCGSGIKLIPKDEYKEEIEKQKKKDRKEPTDERGKYKKNVFRIQITNVGLVKARGINTSIRFDPCCVDDFFEHMAKNKSKQFYAKVKRDKCGDYFLTISFSSKQTKEEKKAGIKKYVVWKPINIPEVRKEFEGVDVGEKTLATLSDGTKYANLEEHNPDVKRRIKSIEHLDRVLSRSEGWRNIDFRERHKSDNSLQVSNTYKRNTLKHQKANRKVKRQKEDWYNKASLEIMVSTKCIAIEGFKVGDLFETKEKEGDNGKKGKKKKKTDKGS